MGLLDNIIELNNLFNSDEIRNLVLKELEEGNIISESKPIGTKTSKCWLLFNILKKNSVTLPLVICSKCQIIFKYDSASTVNKHLNKHQQKCSGQTTIDNFYKKGATDI